jgi:hypothetical protein
MIDRARAWELQNRLAARFILASARRDGAINGLAVRWARAVLSRPDTERKILEAANGSR